LEKQKKVRFSFYIDPLTNKDELYDDEQLKNEYTKNEYKNLKPISDVLDNYNKIIQKLNDD